MSPAETNRANSQHSTGPKTRAGKKKSSLNALRHGLTGQVVVMPSEDLDAYRRHLNSFTDEYQPKGATEAHLVQALADASWRLNRVAALETNLLNLSAVGEGIADAFATAAALESQSKAFANLSIHSQRLSRQFERTVAQLRSLQQLRRSDEKRELDHLLDIMEMCEAKGEPYDPADDGFVFTEPDLAAAIRTRNRQRMIDRVYEQAAA
jgi:hypothetical protein